MTKEFKQLEDGIYFRLHDEIYFGQKRMSSTGIKNLLVSPATFWQRGWLNPNYKDMRDPTARNIGKAYHTALFEPELMNKRFIRGIDPTEYPKALKSGTEVGNVLAKLGVAKTKAGENVIGQANRLRACGYKGDILCLVKNEFERVAGDKIVIPFEAYDQIKIDKVRLRQNPEIKELVTNGASEVSVLWTDANGIKWKCRFDYLKADSFTDKKTFANPQDKALEVALTGAFRYNRYYIQGAIYWQATEVIRTGNLPLFEFDGLPYDKNALWEHRVIEAIQARELPLKSYFLFQEKQDVPNILAKRFKIFNIHYSEADADHMAVEDLYALAVRMNHKSGLYLKAEVEIKYAIKEFLRYSEVYPEAGQPWLPINAVTDFDDEDFNHYWLEGR